LYSCESNKTDNFLKRACYTTKAGMVAAPNRCVIGFPFIVHMSVIKVEDGVPPALPSNIASLHTAAWPKLTEHAKELWTKLRDFTAEQALERANQDHRTIKVNLSGTPETHTTSNGQTYYFQGVSSLELQPMTLQGDSNTRFFGLYRNDLSDDIRTLLSNTNDDWLFIYNTRG
jgi:hypothetical protein